jgi:hypothetical protein
MTIEEAKEILQMEADWDWEKFRRETAKDILTGILSNPIQMTVGDEPIKTINDYLNISIELTDELIKRLKEK